MSIEILHADLRRGIPWRNGCGVTRTIAAAPENAGLTDFDWRVSLAEVHAPCAFSCFEGVDRVLTVLDGALQLTLADQTALNLGPDSPPFAFPGEVACSGRALRGAAANLNVMTRRGRYTSDVCRLQPCRNTLGTGTIMIVAAQAGELVVAATRFQLDRYDAVVLTAATGLQMMPAIPGVLIALRNMAGV